MDFYIEIIIKYITTGISVFLTIINCLYFDKIKKLEDNKNKLRLQTDITNIETKLKTFYIPIYFKLLIISITKKQIKELKNRDIDMYNKIEKDMIIRNHEEIVDIIAGHYTLDTLNDITIEIIKDYINYVILYKNYKNINNVSNIKLEKNIKYPKNFLIEIEKKIIELHEKYESFLGRNEKNFYLNKFISFFRFFCKSKKNNDVNKKLTLNFHDKWSIKNYINNNINISQINKILYDDNSSSDTLYNNIDLNKIFKKIDNEIIISITESIPLEND